VGAVPHGGGGSVEQLRRPQRVPRAGEGEWRGRVERGGPITLWIRPRRARRNVESTSRLFLMKKPGQMVRGEHYRCFLDKVGLETYKNNEFQ
jgi:hypothetical protein